MHCIWYDPSETVAIKVSWLSRSCYMWCEQQAPIRVEKQTWGKASRGKERRRGHTCRLEPDQKHRLSAR
jgi:hypothetical protein